MGGDSGGKTPVPLTILVDGDWLEHPAITALLEKGHTVHECPKRDILLSRTAHYWDDTMFAKPAYLETALKVARARKKEAKTTDAPST